MGEMLMEENIQTTTIPPTLLPISNNLTVHHKAPENYFVHVMGGNNAFNLVGN